MKSSKECISPSPMYTDCNLYNENCMYEKNVLIYKWLTLGSGVWAAVFPTLGSVKECSGASWCGNDGVRVQSESWEPPGAGGDRGSVTAATSKRHIIMSWIIIITCSAWPDPGDVPMGSLARPPLRSAALGRTIPPLTPTHPPQPLGQFLSQLPSRVPQNCDLGRGRVRRRTGLFANIY